MPEPIIDPATRVVEETRPRPFTRSLLEDKRQDYYPQMAQIHTNENQDPQTYAIIGAAMEVHKQLGSGFLEAVYQEALAVEFQSRSIVASREVELPVFYKGQRLTCSYRADFVCYESVIVEIKALREITGIEEAQVLNYLKTTGMQRALLINFGRSNLDFKRFALSYLR